MATVITNLLSAIPIFGKDLVESGYTVTYNSLIENDFINTINVEILPTVGRISSHALKEGKKIRSNKEEYLSIPYSFVAFFVGLVDGDGYIRINKTTKGFISVNLVIKLSLEDISTLEYIYSVLKIGKISKYKDYRNPICGLIINKTDLQEIIFPLLKHHNIFFLTYNRRAQFDRAMYIFTKDIKLYDDLRETDLIPTLFKLPENALQYLNLPFFRNWVIGFTNSEGSFFIKKNHDGCFQLKQRIHLDLFESFKLLFDTKRTLSIDKNKDIQFSVSSVNDIQKVIQFFSFSGLHPLIGLKSIQYLK